MNKRENDNFFKEMKAKKLLEGIEGNVGDVSSNTDMVVAANTKESQEHNNNNYESCVDSNDNVRMCDCCLEGIEPCKCKGNGH